MLKLKLLIIAAFVAFALSAFLFSSNYTQAQINENAAKSDEILEKVTNYKTWQQVQKPDKPKPELSNILKTDTSTSATTIDVLSISNSSPAG
jgi:hypothetical protein